MRLDGSARRLVEDHIGLASRMAGEAGRRWPHLKDEIGGAAVLALCRCAARFEAGRRCLDGPAVFASYATIRVRGAIADVLRDEARRHGRGIRVVPLPRDPADLPAAEDPGPALVDVSDQVESLLSLLPERNRRAMRAIYCRARPVTLGEAGRTIGVSESRMSELQSESLGILRDGLAGMREGLSGEV